MSLLDLMNLGEGGQKRMIRNFMQNGYLELMRLGSPIMEELI